MPERQPPAPETDRTTPIYADAIVAAATALPSKPTQTVGRNAFVTLACAGFEIQVKT